MVSDVDEDYVETDPAKLKVRSKNFLDDSGYINVSSQHQIGKFRGEVYPFIDDFVETKFPFDFYCLNRLSNITLNMFCEIFFGSIPMIPSPFKSVILKSTTFFYRLKKPLLVFSRLLVTLVLQ